MQNQEYSPPSGALNDEYVATSHLQKDKGRLIANHFPEKEFVPGNAAMQIRYKIAGSHIINFGMLSP